MKRTLATIISAITMLGIATPAFAQTGGANRTRWSQPRIGIRGSKQAAIAAYRHRANLAFRRERYKQLVARVMNTMPSQLAVTGGRDQSDYLPFNRPSMRATHEWTLPPPGQR